VKALVVLAFLFGSIGCNLPCEERAQAVSAIDEPPLLCKSEHRIVVEGGFAICRCPELDKPKETK
jgi:hypothetical protein